MLRTRILFKWSPIVNLPKVAPVVDLPKVAPVVDLPKVAPVVDLPRNVIFQNGMYIFVDQSSQNEIIKFHSKDSKPINVKYEKRELYCIFGNNPKIQLYDPYDENVNNEFVLHDIYEIFRGYNLVNSYTHHGLYLSVKHKFLPIGLCRDLDSKVIEREIKKWKNLLKKNNVDIKKINFTF
jgi:hypothetical protein